MAAVSSDTLRADSHVHACSWLRSSEELADFHISDLLCVTNAMFINNESTVVFFVFLLGTWRLMGEVFGYSCVATSPVHMKLVSCWHSEYNIFQKPPWPRARHGAYQLLSVSCTITVIRYLSVPAAVLNNEPRVEIITYMRSLRLLP